MGKLIVLVAVVALCACGQAPEIATRTADRDVEAKRLPLDNTTEFLEGYSLKVTREGTLLWNSAPVSDTVLGNDLRAWSARPHNAGRLFVAFEPGVSPKRAAWVRRQVIDSGLCEQQRCSEVEWGVKRPVVN